MLTTANSEKRDRYRPLFCSSEFYSDNQSCFRLWKNRFSHLSQVEKVRAWVIALTCLRRPNDWYAGFRTTKSIQQNSAMKSHLVTVADLFKNTAVQIPAKVDPNMWLGEFIDQVRIKPLPDSCARSLSRLGAVDYPVNVLGFMPTPLQLLEYQLSGSRVITFNEEFEQWPLQLFGDRDFLSFMIHDLIHADHFFKDKANRLGQIGFYHMAYAIWNDVALQNILHCDQLKFDLEYIISDMNSHPVHLLKTLQSLLSRHLKNQLQIDYTWTRWIRHWSSENDVVDAMQNINTQLFSHNSAKTVERYCIALGQKKSLENLPTLV